MDLIHFQIRDSGHDFTLLQIKNEKIIPGDRKAHRGNRLQVQCQS